MSVTHAAWLLLLGSLAACDRPSEGSPRSFSRAVLEVDGPRHQVGFSRRVRLEARVKGGDGPWSYRWRHLFGTPFDNQGRPVPPSALRSEGAVLELHTRPAPDAAHIARHPGSVVPLSADRAGRVVLEVEARSPTTSLTRVVEVTAAYPAAAWPRAAAGVDVYLSGRGWSRETGHVELADGPPGLTRARWPATGATGEWNRLRHPGGVTLELRGGRWLGSQDCGRFDCHPREQRGWLSTAHASVFDRGVDGRLSGPADPRGPYRRWCAACHTLGDQPGAKNDGFDDRAADWRLSRARPGTSARLPASLAERANVQCESCHGPGWFYTGYGVDICAQCHDHPPRYLVVAQLGRNRMSEAQRDLPQGGPTDRVCDQCHEARAFLRSLRGHDSTSKPGDELDTRRHGVTCAACHDPHGADCPRQLRLCGEVEIPGKTFDAGQGALCIACHSGEANIARGPLLRPYLPGTTRPGGHGQDPDAPEPDPAAAPHAPQFQVLTGRGGKFLRLPTQATEARVYPHMGVPDACVHCHHDPAARQSLTRGHTFKLLPDPESEPPPACPTTAAPHLERVRRSPVTGPCAACHGALPSLNAEARGDYDGDGRLEGIVDEVQGLMVELRRQLKRRIAALDLKDPMNPAGARAASFTVLDERVVAARADCTPLRDRRGAPLTFVSRWPEIHKAAHNYLMVVRDASAGLHNPTYVVRLLQDSIEGLEGEGAPTRRWKRP